MDRSLRGGRVPHPSLQRGTTSARRRSIAAAPAPSTPLICDAGSIPLAVTLTSGNRHDVTPLIPLLDAVPPIRGRPRRRPRELCADCGYDHDTYRRQLRAGGITPRIARRGVAHSSGLGKQRRVVERGFAWPHAFKRLQTRYEHRADIRFSLLQLACTLTCYRPLAALLK